MVEQMFRLRPGDSLSNLEDGLSATVTDVRPISGQLAIDANALVEPFMDPNVVVLVVLMGFFFLYVAIVVYEEFFKRVLNENDDSVEPLGWP